MNFYFLYALNFFYISFAKFIFKILKWIEKIRESLCNREDEGTSLIFRVPFRKKH